MTSQPQPLSAVQRRALAREARDAFPPMGVYAIRFPGIAGARVGSSRNVHALWNRMQFELRRGTHPDRALQAAWHDEPAGVSFEVLELVRQRADAAFDYAGELELLEQLHREQLCGDAAP